jgi:hypothetical protein
MRIQPRYTDCKNCGTADHAGYACPCGCHAPAKLTAEQRRRVRELVQDEGWSRAEAVRLVLAGA